MDHPPETLDTFGIVWRLGATLFFVVLNGFFVAAEFALVKVRGSRIVELAAAGDRRARRVKHVLANLDRYLSACQLGITLASLILGALGEPAVSVLIRAGLEGLGVDIAPDARWVSIVSIGLAFAVITVLHMTLGEQAPKMWALRRAETTALRTSLVLHVFTLVFRPFIVVVNGISNWMLRVAGLPAGDAHGETHTAEEIRSIISLAASSGRISDRQYEITENVFRMISLEVRHILVPRVDIVLLSLEKGADENLARIRQSAHSRHPLCTTDLDSVVGIVHAKDALELALLGGDLDLRAVARPAVFVPDTMSVSNFLMELQSVHGHCAVVLDEHGTAIGLAFREDALEVIVGPLGDEFDQPEQPFRELDDGSFEVSGRMSLPEVLNRLEIELGEGEHEDEETIAGHVTARLGRLPKKGDGTTVGEFRVTVLEVARRRVQRLRFERIDPESETEADAPPAESGPDGASPG